MVDMFLAKLNKNQSQKKSALSASLLTIFSPNNTRKEVKETKLKSQTRDVHNLDELLCLKIIQMDK